MRWGRVFVDIACLMLFACDVHIILYDVMSKVSVS